MILVIYAVGSTGTTDSGILLLVKKSSTYREQGLSSTSQIFVFIKQKKGSYRKRADTESTHPVFSKQSIHLVFSKTHKDDTL